MGEWLNPNGAAGYNWVDSCPYIIDAGFLVENPEGTAILSFPGIFIGNRRVESPEEADRVVQVLRPLEFPTRI